MNFKITCCGEYLSAKAFGKAEVRVFGDMLNNIFQHEKWHSEMSYIVDYSELDASHLSTDDIRQIALITKFLRDNAGIKKSSIVAPKDIQFGLVRMWSVYIENDEETETKVFRTHAEAITWIQSYA